MLDTDTWTAHENGIVHGQPVVIPQGLACDQRAITVAHHRRVDVTAIAGADPGEELAQRFPRIIGPFRLGGIAENALRSVVCPAT